MIEKEREREGREGEREREVWRGHGTPFFHPTPSHTLNRSLPLLEISSIKSDQYNTRPPTDESIFGGLLTIDVL